MKRRKTASDIELDCAALRYALEKLTKPLGGEIIGVNGPHRPPDRDAWEMAFIVRLPSFNPNGAE